MTRDSYQESKLELTAKQNDVETLSQLQQMTAANPWLGWTLTLDPNGSDR